MSESAGKGEIKDDPTAGSRGCSCSGGYMSKKAQFALLLELARGRSKNKKFSITKSQQADLIKILGNPAISATERLTRARAAAGWNSAPCGGQDCAAAWDRR